MVEIETHTPGGGRRRQEGFTGKIKTRRRSGARRLLIHTVRFMASRVCCVARRPPPSQRKRRRFRLECVLPKGRRTAAEYQQNRPTFLPPPPPRNNCCVHPSRGEGRRLSRHTEVSVLAPIPHYSQGLGGGSLWRRSRLSGGNCVSDTSPQNTWRRQNGAQHIMTFSPDGANCPSLDDEAELRLDGCAGWCDNGVTGGRSVPVPASVISHLARFPYLPASKQSRNQKGS